MFGKSRRRFVALIVSVAVLTTACAEPVIREVTAPATVTPTPAPTPTAAPTVANQPTPTPLPFAGEPGITAETLRIGVIYDVGVDPVSDQMARSAFEAVTAWAAAVNTQGGLANKVVEVVPIETRPLLADHAEAIDRACKSDLFALVGSSALLDDLGVEQLESPDCRLPDFPATVTSVERRSSPVTVLSNPVNGDVFNAGWAAYYAGATPERAAAAATMLLDFEVSVIDGERTIEGAEALGLEFVAQPKFAFDTNFVAEVEQLAEAGTRLLIWRADGGRLIGLLDAYAASDHPVPTVLCGQACYSDVWVEAAGRLGRGVEVWLPHLLLEETAESPELNRYLFWLGSTHGAAVEPTSTGIMAWAASLLFEEAVNTATAAGMPEYDPNNLTRAGVIDAARTITVWDANGLHGVSNPAEGLPSPCFALLRLTGGAWGRTYPERPSTADCSADNLVPLTITTGLGSPTPTPTPDPEAEESTPQPDNEPG